MQLKTIDNGMQKEREMLGRQYFSWKGIHATTFPEEEHSELLHRTIIHVASQLILLYMYAKQLNMHTGKKGKFYYHIIKIIIFCL